MEIYELSESFPKEETYSLTDQIRRSSRSVSGQIAEGWRRSKYEAVFVNKMNEAEGEAAETQVWLEDAAKCEYMSREDGTRLHRKYDQIYRQTDHHGQYPFEMGASWENVSPSSCLRVFLSSRFPVFYLV